MWSSANLSPLQDGRLLSINREIWKMPVDSTAGAIMLTIIVVVLYFLPTIHARGRKHPNLDGIFVLNLFLGWTLIGWVAAIIWAVSAFKRDP